MHAAVTIQHTARGVNGLIAYTSWVAWQYRYGSETSAVRLHRMDAWAGTREGSGPPRGRGCPRSSSQLQVWWWHNATALESHPLLLAHCAAVYRHSYTPLQVATICTLRKLMTLVPSLAQLPRLPCSPWLRLPLPVRVVLAEHAVNPVTRQHVTKAKGRSCNMATHSLGWSYFTLPLAKQQAPCSMVPCMPTRPQVQSCIVCCPHRPSTYAACTRLLNTITVDQRRTTLPQSSHRRHSAANIRWIQICSSSQSEAGEGFIPGPAPLLFTAVAVPFWCRMPLPRRTCGCDLYAVRRTTLPLG